MAFSGTIIGFLVSLIVSGVIIFIATKLFGEQEGFGTALLAALIGAIIFTLTSHFIGMGWIAALIGGIAWLIALGSLYSIGWVKAFIVALVVWVFATVVSIALPTMIGPL